MASNLDLLRLRLTIFLYTLYFLIYRLKARKLYIMSQQLVPGRIRLALLRFASAEKELLKMALSTSRQIYIILISQIQRNCNRLFPLYFASTSVLRSATSTWLMSLIKPRRSLNSLSSFGNRIFERVDSLLEDGRFRSYSRLLQCSFSLKKAVNLATSCRLQKRSIE